MQQFDRNVLEEVGEAIGNVGRKLLKRRSRTVDKVEAAFRRRLDQMAECHLDFTPGKKQRPDPDVIDGVWSEAKDGTEPGF